MHETSNLWMANGSALSRKGNWSDDSLRQAQAKLNAQERVAPSGDSPVWDDGYSPAPDDLHLPMDAFRRPPSYQVPIHKGSYGNPPPVHMQNLPPGGNIRKEIRRKAMRTVSRNSGKRGLTFTIIGVIIFVLVIGGVLYSFAPQSPQPTGVLADAVVRSQCYETGDPVSCQSLFMTWCSTTGCDGIYFTVADIRGPDGDWHPGNIVTNTNKDTCLYFSQVEDGFLVLDNGSPVHGMMQGPDNKLPICQNIVEIARVFPKL